MLMHCSPSTSTQTEAEDIGICWFLTCVLLRGGGGGELGEWTKDGLKYKMKTDWCDPSHCRVHKRYAMEVTHWPDGGEAN